MRLLYATPSEGMENRLTRRSGAGSQPNAAYFSRRAGTASLVGRTPWSARDALVPLLSPSTKSSLPAKSRPGGRLRTRGSALLYGATGLEKSMWHWAPSLRRPLRPLGCGQTDQAGGDYGRAPFGVTVGQCGELGRPGRPPQAEPQAENPPHKFMACFEVSATWEADRWRGLGHGRGSVSPDCGRRRCRSGRVGR